LEGIVDRTLLFGISIENLLLSSRDHQSFAVNMAIDTPACDRDEMLY